jgi:hypothetical protein
LGLNVGKWFNQHMTSFIKSDMRRPDEGPSPCQASIHHPPRPAPFSSPYTYARRFPTLLIIARNQPLRQTSCIPDLLIIFTKLPHHPTAPISLDLKPALIQSAKFNCWIKREPQTEQQ